MLTVLTVRFPQAGFRGRAMATGPITKTNVDALTCPPSKDREILWDSDHREAVRGFGIAEALHSPPFHCVYVGRDGVTRVWKVDASPPNVVMGQ